MLNGTKTAELRAHSKKKVLKLVIAVFLSEKKNYLQDTTDCDWGSVTSQT